MKTEEPIRLLTAVPICDGHDSPINTINLELIRHRIEVIYLGYHRSVRDIVRAAIQEEVRAIGLSSYNGGHVEFFTEVVRRLKQAGAGHIGVFGGGGGTITASDAKIMLRRGVDRIFFAGSSLEEMVDFVKQQYGSARRKRVRAELPKRRKGIKPTVVGITGPGGAGKTTLIDELVLRALTANPAARVAILSHDPSIVGKGALLGDRAAMIYSQDDRVFMHSLATRGRAGGLSPETEGWLRRLRESGFDWVFVETVGIGQEAMPFRGKLVDKTVLVMSPDYGARLQLQKIAMLDLADIVAINKSDTPGAKTAAAEVEQRLALNRAGQKFLTTCAKQHRDGGVDQLYGWFA